MKRPLLVVLLLLGCKNVKHSIVTFTPQVHFSGVKTMTVVGNPGDIAVFEKALSSEGITTVAGGDYTLPADLGRFPVTTDYVAGIHGLCAAPPDAELLVLRVEIFDAHRGERLFIGKASADSDCGKRFYREVAQALAQAWP
jgi:hypothetical protein